MYSGKGNIEKRYFDYMLCQSAMQVRNIEKPQNPTLFLLKVLLFFSQTFKMK